MSIARPSAACTQHVVEPDTGFAGDRRLDPVGALVDDAEAHVLEHRHAFR